MTVETLAVTISGETLVVQIGNVAAPGGGSGDDGWSPILAVVTDGARRVHQIADWTGGAGTKPATGGYIGASGIVALIGDAVDIRGAEGAAGATGAAGPQGPQGVPGDAADIATEIHAATEASIADADEVGFWQSVGSALRKITWSNIKATLKTYFDTLYAAISHTHALSGVTDSGATSGQVPTWSGSAWVPQTPSGASPAGSGTELQYRNGSSFGAMSGTAWDDTNRSLTITGATVTTSKPIFDLSQTWNSGGTTFTGWKIDVTNTASATGSKVFDAQVGGVTVAAARADGTFTARAISANTTGSSAFLTLTGQGGGYGVVLGASAAVMHVGNTDARIVANAGYLWTSSTSLAYAGTTDLGLYRDAAYTLAQRVGTNAQTLRVYGTYTDSSNYVRVSLSGSSTAVTLAAQTAGTGADDVPVVITPAGTAQVEIGNGVQFTEMTAPSAPSANKVILYAQDNGAGKTQLMALFASGASQQVAIEP